jgi:hypothetical protein
VRAGEEIKLEEREFRIQKTEYRIQESGKN